MAESQSSFLDRIPRPARIGLYLFLAVILGYLIYSRMFSPLLAERGTLDAQISALEQEVSQLELQVRGHRPVTQDERASWTQTQGRIEERIPPDYRLSELIEQISILAKKANLPDALISSSEKVALQRPPDADFMMPPPAQQNPVSSAAQGRAIQGTPSSAAAPRRRAHITDVLTAGYYPVTISFHGSFQNQGQFLADLAGLSQLIEVESLEVTREYPETAFRIVLKAYHSGKVNRV